MSGSEELHENVGTERLAASDAALLIRATEHFLGSSPSSMTILGLPVLAEMQAASVRRFEIEADGTRLLRLVLKPCPLTERSALALLHGTGTVPSIYVEETLQDQAVNVVMVDPGQSLLGYDDRSTRMAAEALSGVHSRYLGWDARLSALPSLTEQYVKDVIVSACWQRPWAHVCTDEPFLAAFGSWITPVEASAARLPEDLLEFSHRLQLNTLTHTDIHHAGMLDNGGRALIIDWSQARCAPLFLDLGNIFDTVKSGCIYRDALAANGCVFADDVFSRGHQLARRFAGIRNLGFWLQSWLERPRDCTRAGLQRTLTMAAGA